MDYEKAYKASLKTAAQWIKDGCIDKEKICLKCVFPELRESEDERIRKFLITIVNNLCAPNFKDVEKKDVLAYLEKQKEPHYTKRNALFDKCMAECDPAIMKEVSDKIDEMLEKEQKPVQTSEEKEYIRTLKSLISDFIRDKQPADVIYYQRIYDWLEGRHIEQKPNIELIQRSWYMEGYHDREFGKEPKWIIKTGEGGPHHEENPKYGDMLAEQKPAEKHDLVAQLKEHLANTPKEQLEAEWKELEPWGNIGPTVEEYLRSIKPAEWSEEDKKIIGDAYCWLCEYADAIEHNNYKKAATIYGIAYRIKHLRPQPQHRDTYYDIIHSILAMLKDIDFMQITPEHRVSLLNDIRVRCEHADEWAHILDEPQWKPSEEQKEEPDKSLEEEVKRYYSDNFAYISSDQPTLSILTNIARHFAEWQKEQMLKDAVEFECIGKKVKMTVKELIDYYINTECCEVAEECGF